MQSDTKSITKGPFALKISFARCARDDGKLYFLPAAARRRKTLTLMAVWPGKLVPSLAIYDYHYVIGFVHVTDKSLCSKLASSGADALSQNLGSTSVREAHCLPSFNARKLSGGRSNEAQDFARGGKSWERLGERLWENVAKQTLGLGL